MTNYFLAASAVVLLTGCYNDQALLSDPTIDPVENAEDKVIDYPKGYHRYARRGYNRYHNGYYYYDDYYYYNGYYRYYNRRSQPSLNNMTADGEIRGNGPLSYQDSREGMIARDADDFD